MTKIYHSNQIQTIPSMQYITKKDSETGKKFQNLYDKINEIEGKHREFIATHGFYVHSDIMCRIQFCYFPEDNSSNSWRPFDYGYMPDKRTKEGKEIATLLEAIPFISRNELASCVSTCDFVNIKVFNKETDFFGFIIPNKSKFVPPDDCLDVSEETYFSFFNTDDLPF